MTLIQLISEASSEDNQISEFNLTDNDEYYLIEFKLKYSDYTTQSDSLLTYSCKVPKKQIKGLTTGYTKLKKFTRPRIFLNDNNDNKLCTLYISFNYELNVDVATKQGEGEATAPDDTWQFKTMGIDIGVAKSATAAIVTTNMCWAASQSAERSKTGEAIGKSVEASSEANEQPTKQAAIDFTQPVAISNELTISDKTQSFLFPHTKNQESISTNIIVKVKLNFHNEPLNKVNKLLIND